jgi:membrane-associated phospholipid phosphatase
MSIGQSSAPRVARPGAAPETPTPAPAALTRRRFLGRLGGGMALTLAAAGAPPLSRGWLAPGLAAGAVVGPESPEQRRQHAFEIRHEAALVYKNRPLPEHPTNGDEERYATRLGNYSKALPHDALGQVDPGAYAALVHALATNEPAAFEAIPLGGEVPLVNPQAAFAFALEGVDSHQLATPPPPAFASAAAAGELVELYWLALSRDVPFSQYGAEPRTRAALQDLARFPAFAHVTPGTLFRGFTAGDATGPYISQFLWQDVPFGSQTLTQTYRTARPGDDHVTTYPAWLALQNGAGAAAPNAYDPVPRYVRTGRDLGEFVHGCQTGCPEVPNGALSAEAFDASFLAGLNAGLILLGFGPQALDAANPYLRSATQTGFATFGAPHLLDLVGRVVQPALLATWYQKWAVHRYLRPEEYAGRVHLHRQRAAAFPIPQALLGSQALAAVEEAYGGALLPQAYPEGCPSHPAYPSGHATFAGAMVTALKAFFNGAFPIPRPQEATDDGRALVAYPGALTVGGELDKLASNIAVGRLCAGVHWRADAWAGLRVGEAVALSILGDLRRTFPEQFGGFTLTTFDGTPIRV